MSSTMMMWCPAMQAGELEEEEERESGRVSPVALEAYFQALGGYHVVVGFVSVLAMWQTFQVASHLWLSHWTSGRPSEPMTRASVEYNVIYSLLGLRAAVFVLLRALLLARVGVAAARYLFDEMTTSILRAPLRLFDANPIGRIINRYSEDISTIDFEMPFAIFGRFRSIHSSFSPHCT